MIKTRHFLHNTSSPDIECKLLNESHLGEGMNFLDMVFVIETGVVSHCLALRSRSILSVLALL